MSLAGGLATTNNLEGDLNALAVFLDRAAPTLYEVDQLVSVLNSTTL